jgi:hypothetical protein
MLHLKESAGMRRRTTPQCRDRRRSFIEATISADDSSALPRRKPADRHGRRLLAHRYRCIAGFGKPFAWQIMGSRLVNVLA